MSPAKKPDAIALPGYPSDPPQLRQYYRDLSASLQFFSDQMQTAVVSGLLPYQASSFAVTISPGATGLQATFTVALQSASFSVLPTPHWNWGAGWITATSVNGFTVQWSATPSATTSLDYLVYLGALPG